jgi:hypothetical protein
LVGEGGRRTLRHCRDERKQQQNAATNKKNTATEDAVKTKEWNIAAATVGISEQRSLSLKRLLFFL